MDGEGFDPRVSLPKIKGERGWIIDLTGERVGRWLVLSMAGKNSRNKVLWNCRCDCGTERIVESKSLTQRVSRSCGCLREELRHVPKIDKGQAGFNRIFARYQKISAMRNLPFELTKTDVREITQGNCFYCGVSPSAISTHGDNAAIREHATYLYNGIDRVDSNLGYIEGNCVPCCAECNWAKSDYTLDEFCNQTQARYRHLLSEGLIV